MAFPGEVSVSHHSYYSNYSVLYLLRPYQDIGFLIPQNHSQFLLQLYIYDESIFIFAEFFTKFPFTNSKTGFVILEKSMKL